MHTRAFGRPVARIGAWRSKLGRPAVAFAVIALAAVAWLMFEGRHFTFQSDEWDWMLHRRGLSADTFLRPHNEHLSAIPIGVYKLFLQLFGARSTAPYRLLDALLVVACAALVFVLASRRVGGWAALAGATILLFFGPAWNDIVWGFQIGYLGSIAAGLGALLALERQDRRGDLLAGILLTAGLACSSIGLTVLAGAIVEIVLTARRSGWSRLWVVAVPTLLYGIWYSHFGVSDLHLSYAHTVPNYAFTGLSAVAGSIFGLAPPAGSPYTVSTEAGSTIAVLLLLALAIRFVRGAPLSTRFWNVLTVPLAFWTAAALSYIPGREADQSRYTFPVAPLVMLAAAECCSGLRPGRRALIVLGVGAVAAVGSNLGFLRDGVKLFDQTSQYARGELGALSVARGSVSPAFHPEDPSTAAVIGVHNMTPIDAGAYFRAADAFGSPADGTASLAHEPEPVREASDYVLAKAERVGLSASAGRASRCSRHTPAAGAVELTARPGARMTLSAGRSAISSVALRRFADSYKFVSLGQLTAQGSATITLPHDSWAAPWHIRVGSTWPISVCGLG